MKVVKRNENKIWFIVAFEDEFRTKNHNVVYTGPGKVNAAMATQWLIDNHHPSEIINVGTAGGNPSQVEKGLVYVIKRAVDRDWTTPSGSKVAFELAMDVAGSQDCYTGDSFVTDLEHSEYPLVDMEVCAIAAVCKENNVKLKSYKYVSDCGDDEDWQNSLTKCNEVFNRMF